MTALDAITTWPVPHAAAGVTGPPGTTLGCAQRVGAVAAVPSGPEVTAGDAGWRTRLASVTKLLVAYACLVAVEEGTLALDAPAGPPGSTIRHLLAHASGLPFEGDAPIAGPGTRRIYSNTGFEVLGQALAAAAGMPVARYLDEAVLAPLGMSATVLEGSPAHGAVSTIADLLRFGRELLAPALIAPETLAEAVTEQFPGLAGVVPGLGRFDPNAWGLGFELKDAKRPHWTAAGGSPGTFGHFGGAGTFLWVDPDARIACAVLTDREFGDWALPRWSSLSAAVLEELGRHPSAR